ncbi:hypothetical protein BOTCAL_0008g00230 [Botryotinia calthae]|uniref:Uncharacterized protein n=1 Tax=Botryotinia calthae TaxID=38488 RepID=A0A4Y8DJ12_9HELO|nr:hypothetical protein BOTCAL_0008g00230 [Botryotinia calthae]
MQEMDHSHFQDSELLIEGPPMPRAWVYQERFLAPRTVHFTSAEMIWECGSMHQGTIPIATEREKINGSDSGA